MGNDLLMGIDIGTSACKIIAFDLAGRVVASTTEKYDTAHPHPGHVEQDARDWWRAVCTGINQLVRVQSLDPNDLKGIGVAGQSWACLPVDSRGEPVAKAMIWLDRRATQSVTHMKELVGEDELVSLSGNPIDPSYIVPKILWFKKHRPRAYERTAKFLQSNAYIVLKLSGALSQDYSQGYGFHFFDIAKGTWDAKTADIFGVPLDKVAEIHHCHDVVGTVTPSAARETGLIPGIPVVAGGLDAACSTLGAGIIRPGQTQEQGGQAGGMSIQVPEPLVHPKLILGYHVIPNQWLLQGGTVGGGGTLRWFNQQLGAHYQEQARQRHTSAFEVMSEDAEAIHPGSGGLIFLPYMAGERSPLWNTKARGVFFGLSYEKTRAHLVRSMMEGVGYSLLHNLETAEAVGAEINELVSVGGAANSQVWTQIKADITGKTIRVASSDHATTLGAALLAGVGTGLYKGFPEAVKMSIAIQRTHVPDRHNHEIYQEYYSLYRTLYKQLETSYDTLNAIAAKF